MLAWLPLLFACAGRAVARAAPPRRAPPSRWEFAQRLRAHRAGPSGVLYVEDFGGDPLGAADSTQALQAAVAAANDRVAMGAFEGGIADRGGATVHLGGGEFLVSDTVWLGKGGNVRICCGSIRAAPSFPADRYLLYAGGGGELMTIDNVMFDCNKSAAGAVAFDNFLRAHLSQVYIVHFKSIGVHVTNGHEVHISDCFIGEYIWYENHPDAKTLTGTAIQIDGQDSWISDTVIFSGLRGIVMNGGASTVTNTHIYNGGDAAMVLTGTSIRVLGSYMDFNPVIAVDPVAISVSDCFFLGGVGLEIHSSGPGRFVSGLYATRNHFVVGDAEVGPWEAFTVNESAGAFVAVNDTLIADNAFPPATYGPWTGQSMKRRGTVVRRALRQESSKLWTFDLTDELAFPSRGIDHVSHEVALHSVDFASSVLRYETGGVVKVEFDKPVSATVFVEARQGLGQLNGASVVSAV